MNKLPPKSYAIILFLSEKNASAFIANFSIFSNITNFHILNYPRKGAMMKATNVYFIHAMLGNFKNGNH
jgi:hypothetical protein